MARKLPGGTASIRSLTSRYGSSSAGMQGIQAQPDRPVTALGHGALSSDPQNRDLMQVNGPRAGGAYWHTRAARATMTGWIVMTARPCCGWPLCPFWTEAGPRGRADG